MNRGGLHSRIEGAPKQTANELRIHLDVTFNTFYVKHDPQSCKYNYTPLLLERAATRCGLNSHPYAPLHHCTMHHRTMYNAFCTLHFLLCTLLANVNMDIELYEELQQGKMGRKVSGLAKRWISSVVHQPLHPLHRESVHQE